MAADKKASTSCCSGGSCSTSSSKSKSSSSTTVQNGKGDAPRNNLSKKFRNNFDSIDWSK